MGHYAAEMGDLRSDYQKEQDVRRAAMADRIKDMPVSEFTVIELLGVLQFSGARVNARHWGSIDGLEILEKKLGRQDKAKKRSRRPSPR